jgi:hypothetical protein
MLTLVKTLEADMPQMFEKENIGERVCLKNG